MIKIPASKSISNRLLILQYLYPQIKIQNFSTAKDTFVLQEALQKISERDSGYINIGHAGTSMRFLTALISILENKKFVLDGSARMKQRPIKILVDALQSLGVNIKYIEKEGFPPLLIQGKKIKKNHIKISGAVSSQYITALLLIAPKLPSGLSIELTENIVSKPYIQMTVNLMRKLGVEIEWTKQTIDVKPIDKITPQTIFIEGDWSSASYFYGLSLLTDQKLTLFPFHSDSFQGDKKLIEYFKLLGVETQFLPDNKIHLCPINNFKLPKRIEWNLIETPDLAQTFVVLCFLLKIPCYLSGLQTLKIKETDRLLALKNELEKLGARVLITDNSLEILSFDNYIEDKPVIKTYADHRMAMSFALAQKKNGKIIIENPDVVVKSFPDFWEKFNEI